MILYPKACLSLYKRCNSSRFPESLQLGQLGYSIVERNLSAIVSRPMHPNAESQLRQKIILKHINNSQHLMQARRLSVQPICQMRESLENIVSKKLDCEKTEEN